MWKNLGVKLLLMRNEEATRCSNHSGWSSGRCLTGRACFEVHDYFLREVALCFLLQTDWACASLRLPFQMEMMSRLGQKNGCFFFSSSPSLYWSAKSRCLSCFQNSFKMWHQRQCVRSICKNTSGVGYRNKWDMAPSLGSFEMQAVRVNLLWNASLRCV